MVARQYKEKHDMYKQTAMYWTYIFAVDNKTDAWKAYFKAKDDQVDALMARAKCERGAAISALSCHGWDTNQALASL